MFPFDRLDEDRVQLISGYEPNKYPKGNGNKTILDTSGHKERFKEDLKLMHEMGIKASRMPVPWNQIQIYQNIEKCDWSWMDEYIKEHEKLDILMIADICHYTIPEWIKDGFANPKFPQYFVEFVTEFARRYPDIKFYTLINEPVATSALCTSIWEPKMKDGMHIMRKNMGKAICMASKALLEINKEIKFIHTDPAEYWIGIDKESKAKAKHFNELERFLFFETITGFVNKSHNGYNYLLKNGYTETDLTWFQNNRAQIDVLALDYYLHNERIIGLKEIDETSPKARGLKEVFMDFYNRYHKLLPDMKFAIGEFNARSSVKARVGELHRGLKAAEEIKQLIGKENFLFACWYPFVNSKDWGGHTDGPLSDMSAYPDPVGLYETDAATNQRLETDITLWAKYYIKNNVPPDQIPNYAPDGDQLNTPQRLASFEKEKIISQEFTLLPPI